MCLQKRNKCTIILYLPLTIQASTTSTSDTECPSFSPLTPVLSSVVPPINPVFVSTPSNLTVLSQYLTPELSSANAISPVRTLESTTATAPSTSSTTTVPQWHGFKIVGDNLDRNITPRYQRLDSQTRSLHFFNSLALLDRCNFSTLSDSVKPIQQSDIDITLFLPNEHDLMEITRNFAIIIGRIIHKYVPFFSKIPGLSIEHIVHEHYTEMSRKSEMVNSSIYFT